MDVDSGPGVVATPPRANGWGADQWNPSGGHPLDLSDPLDPQAPAHPDQPQAGAQAQTQAPVELTNMEWWEKVEWSSMHSPTTTFPKVPLPLRSALAELREHIARGAARNEGAREEETHIKAYFFLDRLLFSSIKTRGGKRGQKGESISTAITRRIRQAWEGEWEKLWEDSSSPPPSAQGAKQTPTQILSRDIKGHPGSPGRR